MNALTDALAAVDARASIAVALSGGPDSTALLHALIHARRAGSVRAIHVRHDLAPEAGRWADHCKTVCRQYDIDYAVVDAGARAHVGELGVEAAARRARYAVLRQALRPGEILTVAHHADDQAETFLIQALRGAGVDGLAAMPQWARLGAGWLWRPWLSQPRAAIAAYGVEHGLESVIDPSNRDSGLARGFLREHVMPAIADGWPQYPATLSRSAAWASRASEAITALAAIDYDKVGAAGNTLSIPAIRELSTARRHAVMRHWLETRKRDVPDHRHLDQINRLLESSEHNSPRVRFAATEIRRFDKRLFAMSRLGESPAPCAIDWDGTTWLELPCGAGRLSPLVTERAVLRVGFRRGGERLARAQGTGKRLSDWLREHRVPPWWRKRLPLIWAGDILIGVADIWRHPEIDSVVGQRRRDFAWRHALVGDPVCESLSIDSRSARMRG